ncbi:sugar transferase [Carnobacterium funditum]|uniref:sugar transferase n=1 Tax=Carnobacterium funditum TaxID=2752 RepID=UPI00054CE1C3|nr:sugar transferase [Carnobacterium funditum]
MNQGEKFSKTKKILIGAIDIALFHFSILLSFYLQFGQNIPERNLSTYTSAVIYIMVPFIILNLLFGAYVLYNKSLTDFIYLTIIIQILMTIAIMAVTFAGRWFAFPRSVLVISLFTSSLVLIIWRIIIFKVYLRYSGTKKVMVVGNEMKVASTIFNFDQAKNGRHKITLVAVDNFYKNIKENMNAFDIVYLASQIKEEEKIAIYDLMIKYDKKIFLTTSFENLILVNPNIMNIEDESIIEASNFRISDEDSFIKRITDILFSLLLIILSSPLMIITAILVKTTSKGPIFYKQVRITKDSAEFNVLKFRSMSATAESDTGPVLAASNDTRVTTVGKYIRALRIDELPQLFNVIKGDMSVVGPRPERPFFVNQFQKENKYYYLRHNVRAGITGYAQVYGKYATDFNSKLNFDLLYIKKYSILLDIKIMLQTIKILFDKVSSQGLEEQQNGNKKIPENVTVLK